MNREDDMTRYDDDRLLAFALGLEDDPDLDAALAEDSALRERVEAMRADIDAVAAGLERVVPAPPDGYTDLGAPKWGELRELVTAPAPAAPRRRPTWLRVLAPAAAIALVLVAGVVGLQRLGDGGDRLATTTEAGDKAAPSYDREGGALSGVPGAEDADDDALYRTPPDPGAYTTVVVARAQAPRDDRQRFDVLRTLRGEAGAHVSLKMTQGPLPVGTLALLYLGPISHADSAGAAPTPSPVATAFRDATSAGIVAYQFRGRPALARQLPGGTDPDKVTLP